MQKCRRNSEKRVFIKINFRFSRVLLVSGGSGAVTVSSFLIVLISNCPGGGFDGPGGGFGGPGGGSRTGRCSGRPLLLPVLKKPPLGPPKPPPGPSKPPPGQLEMRTIRNELTVLDITRPQ